MRIDDRILKTIVFVGVHARGTFVPHGTAFLTAGVVGESTYQTLVTARHVIERIPTDVVTIRINTHGGAAKFLPFPKADWISHPDKRVDVAVCPSVISPGVYDILHLPIEGPEILTDKIIAERDFGIGDEVYLAGMFVSRLGQVRNLPIVRTGTIASMIGEKIETTYGYHHAYLIEARSIDGLSGSPVYIRRQPWRNTPDGKLQMQHGYMQYLLGMVLGHNRVDNAGDEIEILQKIDRPDLGTTKVRTPLNTGIAVVIPYSYVVEAITQPKIFERWKQAMRSDPTPRTCK